MVWCGKSKRDGVVHLVGYDPRAQLVPLPIACRTSWSWASVRRTIVKRQPLALPHASPWPRRAPRSRSKPAACEPVPKSAALRLSLSSCPDASSSTRIEIVSSSNSATTMPPAGNSTVSSQALPLPCNETPWEPDSKAICLRACTHKSRLSGNR